MVSSLYARQKKVDREGNTSARDVGGISLTSRHSGPIITKVSRSGRRARIMNVDVVICEVEIKSFFNRGRVDKARSMSAPGHMRLFEKSESSWRFGTL